MNFTIHNDTSKICSEIKKKKSKQYEIIKNIIKFYNVVYLLKTKITI